MKSILDNSLTQIDPKTLTLEQLRYKRAESLIRLELCKAKLANEAIRTRQQAQNQGLRGLLFNSITQKRLRTADYLALGMKGGQLLLRLYRRSHRH